MRKWSAAFVLGTILLATLPVACSLLYQNYDSRFASADASDASAKMDGGAEAQRDSATTLVVEEASIETVTVTSSSVFYSIGGQILSVLLDGGDRSLVWDGDAGASVLALTSDGDEKLAWSYGALQGTINDLYLSDAAAAANAVRLVDGTGLGNYLAADSQSVVWSTRPSVSDAGSPLFQIETWSEAAAPLSLELTSRPSKGAKGAIGARAIALSPTNVYAVVSNIGLVAFSRTTTAEACATLGFGGPATYAALATAPGQLYFLSSNEKDQSGNLTRYAMEGGCPDKDAGVVIENAGDVSLVICDESSVYWVTMAGEVRRAALEETTSHALGTTGTQPNAIALDATHVYVAAGSAIVRFEKVPP